MLVKVQKRFANRFGFQASYALQRDWSDNYPVPGGTTQVWDLTNWKSSYGQDLAHHNFNFAGTMDLRWGFSLSVNSSFISSTPVGRPSEWPGTSRHRSFHHHRAAAGYSLGQSECRNRQSPASEPPWLPTTRAPRPPRNWRCRLATHCRLPSSRRISGSPRSSPSGAISAFGDWLRCSTRSTYPISSMAPSRRNIRSTARIPLPKLSASPLHGLARAWARAEPAQSN